MDVRVGQDLRRFKTKDIGNFSFKEAAFIAVSLAAGYGTFKLTNGSLEISLIPMAIILVFGFFKPCGMSCWQFIRTVVADKFTPRKYKYESDFVYDPQDLAKRYGDEAISSAWNDVIHTDPKSNKIEKSEKSDWY